LKTHSMLEKIILDREAIIKWIDMCQIAALEMKKELKDVDNVNEKIEIIDNELILSAIIGENEIKYEVPDNYWIWKN